MDSRAETLLRHFQARLADSPADAYREWFRLQEELRENGESEIARALAEDLWAALPGLGFASQEEKARFFHNVAVFFGSPGPAADLDRARIAFREALQHFSAHGDDGWRARALHNLATAVSNLGRTPVELADSVDFFERALEWRTPERPIARAATLHNQGIAWKRWAALEPARAPELLDRAIAAFREAIAIRERERLAEGRARSLLQLAEALDRSADRGGPQEERQEAQELFEEARREFARLGLRLPADTAGSAGDDLAGR